jgi:hypothetical protein
MKKLLSILILTLSLFVFTNCEKNEDSAIITKIDYVGFESGFVAGVDPTGTLEQEIKIAVSQISSADRTFNIAVVADLTSADPSAYSLPSSVTVPGNSTVGKFMVNIVGENVNPSGDDILTVEITTEDEGLFKSDPISINLKQVCPNPELFIDITFDLYPEEVYWRVLDANDDTVSESVSINGDDPWGAYAGATPGEGTSKAVCLSSGTYTFEVYDKFQDGGGPISLTVDGEVVFASDGDYGFTTSTLFTIP